MGSLWCVWDVLVISYSCGGFVRGCFKGGFGGMKFCV